MATTTRTALLLLGRVMFGGYFAYNGVNHFVNAGMMSGYAASEGVPLPMLAVLGTGGLMLAGGLSVLFGIRPRLGAAAIVLFLAGVTPVMHDFWSVADAEARATQMVHFTKNLALIGGALFAAAVRQPWPVSIERRQARHHHAAGAAA